MAKLSFYSTVSLIATILLQYNTSLALEQHLRFLQTTNENEILKPPSKNEMDLHVKISNSNTHRGSSENKKHSQPNGIQDNTPRIKELQYHREVLDLENVTNTVKDFLNKTDVSGITDKVSDAADDVQTTLNQPPTTWSQYQWILIVVIVLAGGCVVGCMIKCFCCR